MDRLQFGKNGQWIISGDNYLEILTWYESTRTYVSNILCIKWEDDIDPIDGCGYVNTVFVEIYVLLSENVTSWGVFDER